MPIMNKRDRYGLVAVTLHWLLFILIAGLVASGKYSDSLPRADKIPELIVNHKQVGIAVFFLMAFRLLWRLINTSPESFSESSLLRFAAWLTHWLLYLAILGQALIGILMTQASNRDAVLLGWKVPLLVGQHGMLGIDVSARMMRTWHEYGGWAIIGLAGVHIIAALIHHFFWADDTLRRMSFRYIPDYMRETHSRR